MNSLNKTSEATWAYNCIAWAMGDNQRYWWPLGGYWPNGVNRELNANAFIEAFFTEGYVLCDRRDVEEGYEKVVLYEKDGKPTHAARQLTNGKWTSKLGPNIDVEHTIDELNIIDEIRDVYGEIKLVFKRPKT